MPLWNTRRCFTPMEPRRATVRAGLVVWRPMAVAPVNTPVGWIWERLTITAPESTNTENQNQRRIMPKKSNQQAGSASASSLSELGSKIVHYIRAGYAGLYLVSPEEQRV